MRHLSVLAGALALILACVQPHTAQSPAGNCVGIPWSTTRTST